MPRKKAQDKFRHICAALLGVIGLCVFGLIAANVALPITKEHTAWLKLPDATVAIASDKKGDWRGSGVDVGDGKVLTAAHVVEDDKTLWIWAQGGERIQAEVLWTNDKFDVALLYVPGLKTRTSPLSCKPVGAGTPIEVVGSPGDTDFVHTWGHVARTAPNIEDGTVQMLTDVSIAPGNSGGPVFTGTSYDRKLVGIVSSVSIATVNKGKSIYGTGIARVIPGQIICGLLARS
jgi:S1-C subfamily serine protease